MKAAPKPDPILRVVFDTSVLLSIAGRPSGNYTTWKVVLDGDIRAVTSNRAIEELRDVLNRPKIRMHYGASLDPQNVDRFITGYRAAAIMFEEPESRFVLQDNPKDSLFFDLAIASSAGYLVSYDELHILAVRDLTHPQHQELAALAPNLKLVKPLELASELRQRST